MVEHAVDEKVIFLAALEQATTSEREAYLQGACAGNAELLRRMKELLAVHQESQGPLDAPLPGLGQAPTMDEPAVTERPGTIIGPYKLLEQIGEGGFGLVFMAEQQQPIRRKVAVKILKPGMDSRQVIARFEAERQALALMDHPNIAKVHEAGETAGGRPYFVMELVKGIPITDYCDQNQSPIRERLNLFVPVCQAVQHAHQKGIIHRDIKPTNVLVTLHDGTPVVKVIDFGIAKALGPQLTDKTLFTGFAQLIGTPMYLSPEQAALSGLDVDTRSDIYSLGVLLYELLTGTTPFDKERLSKADFDEVRRIIREEEPPKPSTRLSTMGMAATTLSTQRNSDPKKLSQLFRGELDWIVMKALDKDRNRRYETAGAFAADVQRYLNDEPVHACPPSTWYRFRKFARRNRAALVMAAVVALAGVLTVGSFGWVVRDQAARRDDGERGVEDALVEAATLREQAKLQPRDAAQHQAAIAAALSAVKRGERLFPMGGSEALRQRLAELRADLEEREQDAHMAARLEEIRLVEGDPDPNERETSKARARRLGFQAFREYGIGLEAAEPAAIGYRIQNRAIRLELVAILDNWAWLALSQEEGPRLRQIADVADPDPQGLTYQMRHAVAAGDRAALIKLAQEARVDALAPTTLADLGTLLLQMGETDKGVRLLRRAQEQYPDNWWISRQLATGLLMLNPPDRLEALRYLNAALALRPRHAVIRLDLGNVLQSLDRTEEAAAAYRKVIGEYTHSIELDAQNPQAWRNRAEAYYRLHQYDKATADLSKVIELDPKDVPAWINRGAAYIYLHQYDKALPDLNKAIQLDPKSAVAHINLGDVLSAQGKLDDGIAEYRKAIEIDPKFYRAHVNLAAELESQGNLDEGVAECRKAIEIDPKLAAAHNNLGNLLRDQHHLDEAAAECRKAIELDPKLAQPHLALGNVLRDQGHLDEALAEYRKAIEIDPKDVNGWMQRANTYRLLDQPDKAVADLNKVIELDPKNACPWNNRGLIYCDHLAEYDKAVADFSKAIELDSKFVEAWSNRGTAYNHLHQYDKGLADLNKAIELDAKNASPWNNRGLIYCEHLAEYDKAVADFSKAIELDPKFVVAWSNRGIAYNRLRQYDKALADMNRATELDPNSASACDTLAWFLATCSDAKLRDSARAVRFAKKAVETAPKEGMFRNTLGLAHYRAGSWKDAITAIDKSVERSKEGDSVCYFVLAMAHRQLGEKETANKWFSEAVQWMEKNQPKNEELRRLRAEAAELLEIKEQKK